MIPFRKIAFLAILGTTVQVARAADELREINQITTYPQSDFQPAVSWDGKWLAFVSQRSGNLDIWVKRLPNGETVQVTNHQSDDLEPAWAPDGRAIVFTSKRRDAEGDVWLVKINRKKGGLPQGDPVQLTTHFGLDGRPCFSPDGGKIVYVSDEGGGRNLRILEVSTRKTEPLTRNGGSDPAWSTKGNRILFTSYLHDPGGDIALLEISPSLGGRLQIQKIETITQGPALDSQAAWSPRGDKVVFVRRNADTDGDGQVTPLDRADLWIRIFNHEDSLKSLQPVEFQITSDFSDDADPCFGTDGRIAFTSDRGKGVDVWSMPENGVVTLKPTSAEMMTALDERFSEVFTEEALRQEIVEYGKIPILFPGDSVRCSRAWLRIGELHVLLGEEEKARTAFERVLNLYASRKREAETALLRLAGLKSSNREDRIRQCRQLVSIENADPSVQADAWILLGDLLLEKKENTESFAAYGKVPILFPNLKNSCAQSLLRIGDLFESEDQSETASQYYFSVLKQFGNVPLWRERAGERLLSQVRGSEDERIGRYGRMIQDFSDYPPLMAEAQFAIARLLIDQGQYDTAVRELERIPSLVPTQDWAHARAKILHAEASRLRGDELRGIFLLESVIKDYSQVEAGRFSDEARDSLFNLCYESGERLKAQGDLALAASRYRKAMELRPNDIRVHRGNIETQARMGKADAVVESYRELLARKPKSPVLLYGYGLALSYQGERDRETLKKSNASLLQSLDADYRIVYPYRTMGYNYEAMEKLAESEKAKIQPWTFRAVKTLMSPLAWVSGILPIRRAKGESGYTEKAIDVLTTALELNDESADRDMEISLTQNLANNFYSLGEFGFSKAFQYYQKRLDMDTSFSSALEKAVFFERAGHAALYTDEIEASSKYLTLAVQNFGQLGREEDVMRNLRRRAWLRQQAGKYEDAASEYAALADRDERSGRWSDLELDYRNVAYNYHLLNEHEDALKYALKAERILDTQEIPKGPSKKSYLRIGIFGFSIPVWGMEEIGGASSEGFTLADEQAFVTGLAGRSYESLRQYSKALGYERKRLDLFVRRKDRIAQRICLNRMGLLHFQSAAYDSAWDYFFKSFKACEKQKDIRGEWANAVDLGNTAIVQFALNTQTARMVQTKNLLEAVLGRYSEESAISRRDRISAHHALGTLSLYQSQSSDPASAAVSLETALKLALERLSGIGNAGRHFQTGLALAREGGLWKEEAAMLASLAETNRMTGDNSAARSCLEESRRILERESDDELLWRVEASLARLASAGRVTADSSGVSGIFDLYRSAMGRLEILPVIRENGEPKLADRQERESVYADAACFMIRSGRLRESLVTAERGREKRIADLLSLHPPDLRKERHKVAWGNLLYTRNELADKHRQFLSASMEGMRPSRLRRIKEEEQGIAEDYQKQLQGLEKEDALLAYLAGGLSMEYSDLLRDLPDNGGALCFFSGKNHTLGWFVSRDTIAAAVIQYGRIEMEARVGRLLRCITADSLVQSETDSLFEILIRPFEGHVLGSKPLVIVPDGILWCVPFGLLLDERAGVRGPVLTYAPSLVYNRLVRERRKINQETGIIVGDIREQALSGVMNSAGIREKAFFGDRATEQEFVDGLGQSDLVQVETRILTNENDPLSSAIVLNPDPNHEGYFRAEDCFGLDIRASLMILPAVSAGRGLSWDPTVFCHALLYSDVPSVMMTQWPVQRQVKRAFFGRFYRDISEGSLIQAMERAETEVRLAHPAPQNWAGFALIGFPGMNPDERFAFAGDNQVQKVIQARYYEEKQEFPDAISEFEKAIPLTRIIRDSSGLSKIYQEIVRVAIKGKIWPKAIQYQKLLLAVNERTKNQQGILTSCRNLVYFFMQTGQFADAVSVKTRQIGLLDSLAKTGDLILSYEEMGFIQSGQRKYLDAVAWIEKAVALRGRDDRAGIARDCLLKGRFLLEAEDFWEARKELSLGVFTLDSLWRAGKGDEKLTYDLASGMQLLGIACEKLSQFVEAAAYQEKAIDRFISLSRPVQVAQGKQYLTNVYWKTGNYQKALSLQNETLAMLKNLDNKKLLAMANGTMGLIHLSLGDLATAAQFENRALDVVGQEPSLQADRAAYLKNLGLISFQEGHSESAMVHFLQALAIDSALGLQSGLAYDYRNMGNSLIAGGREKDGGLMLRKAFTISNALGDTRNSVQCRYGLAQVYEKTGELESAQAMLDSAISEIEGIVIFDLSWRLLRLRGKLHARSGRTAEALSDFRNAVAVVEESRGGLKIEAFQQGFFDERSDLYEDAIRLLLDMQQPEEAFRLAESAKSLDYVDLLANQFIAFPERQSAFLERERHARQAVREAQDQLSKSVSVRGRAETDLRKYWTVELENRKREHRQMIAELQTADPELASFVNVDAWDAGKIQSLLPDSAAIVEYFTSRNGLVVWVIRKTSLRWKHVVLPLQQLTDHVGQLREAVQSRLSADLEAKMLYQWLIGPVEAELSGLRHLVIIPHGILHYLPFAALENEQGETLMERFSMSNAPSATVLGFCMEKSRLMKPRSEGGSGVFAIGNPDLGDARYDLPFAEREVKAIRRTFANVTAVFRNEATLRAVEQRGAAAADVMHFACHAETSAETPLHSALRLAPEQGNDGRLSAQEIFGLAMPCGLVTLSACETGLTKAAQGGEIVGLARSFIYAGAPSVIASLWKVDDLATAVLMKRFYRYLKAGYSKAEALRKAQVLVKNAVNAHPSAWAAFGLTGDFQ